MDARTNTFLLRQLVVSYCKHSGSSKGIRAFIEEQLPKFQKEYPHLEVEIKVRSGQHPFVQGSYRNGVVKPIGVKNQEPNQILEYARLLANQWGSRDVSHTGKRVFTKTPSVQGLWTPYLNRPATVPPQKP